MVHSIAARVIGIDPGKATGIVVVDLIKNPPEFQDWNLLRNFAIVPHASATVQQDSYAKTFRIMAEAARHDMAGPLVIVNEKYVVTRMSQQTQDTQSLDVTGMTKAVLEIMDIEHQFFEQLPSEAKLFMSDERLKGLGLWDTKATDHAMDAMRHAATWCVKYVQSKAQLRPIADMLGGTENPSDLI